MPKINVKTPNVLQRIRVCTSKISTLFTQCRNWLMLLLILKVHTSIEHLYAHSSVLLNKILAISRLI